ncbi:MAG TPA: phosphoribosylanthranilate isomerase [Gemmataceae bacterium]|jgi:phosphoribosylanthranilate isomerase|nr:phosphoribosylanthranilate isomerase [Gemmataceae bacterium]
MSSHLRIKICGVTSGADASEAALIGADAIGLNFFPQSPRYVAHATAESILRQLPPFVDAVGVFVNQRLRDVCEVANRVGRIRTVQWHGEQHEPDDPFPLRLIAAFPVADQHSLLAVTRYLDQCRGLGHLPAAVLVDAHVPGRYGGTGQTAPWCLLADFRPGVPVILAGGLTPDNVAEAVRIVRPYGIDVASGVESTPGRKDAEKMRRFIGNAREAAAR